MSVSRFPGVCIFSPRLAPCGGGPGRGVRGIASDARNCAYLETRRRPPTGEPAPARGEAAGSEFRKTRFRMSWWCHATPHSNPPPQRREPDGLRSASSEPVAPKISSRLARPGRCPMSFLDAALYPVRPGHRRPDRASPDPPHPRRPGRRSVRCMFLAPTPPRLTRRSRLDNILLLLLRASALALLALAFARPFLREPVSLNFGDVERPPGPRAG